MMLYIILCAISLALQFVIFIFCFCPLAYNYIDFYSKPFTSIVDLIGQGNIVNLTHFLLSLISVVILVALLVLSIMIYTDKSKKDNTLFVKIFFMLSVIQTIISTVNYGIRPYQYFTDITSSQIFYVYYIASSATIQCLSLFTTIPSALAHYSKKRQGFGLIHENVSSAEDDENKNQGGIDIKTQSNKTELIIKYHNLFKEGIISEEEFEKKKKELL